MGLNNIELYFYQAECGDAARIHFKGNDSEFHNIFIDAGYERTFSHVLKNAIEDAKSIDLWLISHIHDDHVGGLEGYLSALKRKEVKVDVKEWLYNPPRKSIAHFIPNSTISRVRSIRQGDVIWDFIVEKKLQPLTDICSDLPFKDVFGMKLYFLTPSVSKLKKLRKKYALSETPLQREELIEISNARGPRVSNDYQTKLEQFDLDIWNEDDNVENGSSISILTDLNGFKVLWLADAHPDDIVSGLEKHGFTPDKPLICNYVKVTHHGSKGNNNDALFDRIRCEKYIFSVNGENLHCLPNKEVLSRILRNKKRDIKKQPYIFYFTYDNATLRRIFDVDGSEVFTKFNFRIVYSDAKYIKIP